MEKRNRTQLVLGLLLILVAGWLIATQINKDLAKIIQIPVDQWPVWVILAGAVLLVIGLLVGEADMAVPACIVAGIGGILYYQNYTSNWESWSYMWTLIPGFVGIGIILSGIIGGKFISKLREGVQPLLASAIMFTIFASIFQAWSIFQPPYNAYVPIALLFILGIWFIVRGFLRQK